MKKLFTQARLSTKLVLLIGVVSLLPLLVENVLIISRVEQEYYATAGSQVGNVAKIVAHSDVVRDLLSNPTPENRAAADDYLSTLQRVTEVKFIVIIDMRGIRLHHPQKDKIGKHVVGGDEGDALRGKSYISTAEGTFGLSLRAFAPIFGADGRQIGAVLVGRLASNINEMIANLNRPILYALLFSFLLGGALAVMLSRSIKKSLFGLEPAQIAKSLEERTAVLSTVREGIVAINRKGELTLVNAEAGEILRKSGISGLLLGRDINEIIPSTRLDRVMATGRAEYDWEQSINGTVILTNRVPLYVNNVLIGAIATFRDMTEVRRLAEELTGVNRYVDALRSQSHEFLNKLHVIYGLLQGNHLRELDAYLNDLIGNRKKEARIIHDSVKDPILAGFLGSKFSRARELGADLRFASSGELPPLPRRSVHSLVTILGNLLDNGLEALQNAPRKKLELFCEARADVLELTVRDSGTGMPPEIVEKIFSKGWSTKGENRGMGLWLVFATLDELDGTIEVDTAPGRGSGFTVRLPMSGLREGNAA